MYVSRCAPSISPYPHMPTYLISSHLMFYVSRISHPTSIQYLCP